MDSQYKLLSELLSDQAAFITSPKTSLANYWGGGGIAPPPSVYGPDLDQSLYDSLLRPWKEKTNGNQVDSVDVVIYPLF